MKHWLGLTALLLIGKSLNAHPDIRLNSLGYLSAWPKHASVLNADKAQAWGLHRAGDGQRVAKGVLSDSSNDSDTGHSLRTVDFSAYRGQGSFYLEIPGVGRSEAFKIGNDSFREALGVTMLGLYGLRCGTAVAFDYQGQHYGHPACHTDDGHLDRIGQPGAKRDGTGGWHDAGDYNKYSVNSGISLGCLLQAWQDFEPSLKGLRFLPAGVAEQVPLPQYLAELKWQLDWLLKMQYSATDGRVSHKLSAENFDGFEMPEQEKALRYFVPYSSAATGALAAAAAKASRIYEPYDAAYAARLKEAALLSWKALLAEPADVPADQSDFNTGRYGAVDAGTRLWAAAEVWDLTGDAQALAFFEGRLPKEPSLCDADWDWGAQKNLGVLTYAFSQRPGRDPHLVAQVKDAIVAAADTRVEGWQASGYGRTLVGKYYWGSNGSVARAGLVLAAAQKLTGKKLYAEAAVDQVAYLFGRNGYGRSQCTGLGMDPPLHPHHRPSGADAIDAPWPGLLVGGGLSASDWQDSQPDYKTNEIAINWNTALTYLLAYCDQLAPEPGAAGAPFGGR